MADTGRPLLLDFGAARRVIGDMTQALTAILKPGYAPVEQYADMPGLKQGPWTDVYALAAVVHWIIMGKTPPPSVGRLFDDPYVPLTTSAAGRYSDAFLRAIDHGLAVMPEKRTTSIEAMRVELFGGTSPTNAPLPAATGAGGQMQEVPRSQPHARTETQRLERTQQVTPPTERAGQAPLPSSVAPQASSGSKMPLLAGGLGLVVVAALAAYALWPKAAPPGATATGTPAVAAPAIVVPPAASTVAASIPATTSIVATPARTDTPAVQTPVASAPSTATNPPATLPSRDTPAVADTTRPVADAEAKPVVRKPPPTRAETRPETRDRPAAPAEARPVEPKAADNTAECTKIFQLISLGQADQAVMDRFRTLRCR
jgi:hypothetical protein